MSKGLPAIITYGTHDAMRTGEALKSEPFLEVQFNSGIHEIIRTQLVGDYNLPNVLCAAAAGNYFGVPGASIKSAIETYIPSNSRSQLIKKDTNTIILDAYNANPSSMKAAIKKF